MRVLVLVALAACGGSPKPPATASSSDSVSGSGSGSDSDSGTGSVSDSGTATATAPTPERTLRREVTPSSICTPQQPDDCVLLGTNIQYGGPGFTKDLAKAAAYYKIACDADDTGGCTSLAEMYEDGKGVPQSSAESMRLLRHACDLGDCATLAFELIESDTPADRTEALTIFARICDADDDGFGSKGRACHMRGDRARTLADGAPWILKACDAGHDQACEQLRRLYFNDELPNTTPAQATRALEKMCDAKSIDACMLAAQRHFEGKGVPASRAESQRWQQKACDAGDQQTCQRLEMQRRYGN